MIFLNGSENGFAGALFFSLVSIGALLKVDDIIGWGIGAFSALAAAICLRKALAQAADAAEDDHQRIEIQFQQLRNKVGESSSHTASAMSSIGETSDTLREDLQGIRSRMATLDNLSQIAETSGAMGAALQRIEDNTSEFNSSLKKILEGFDAQKNSSQELAEKIEKITEKNSAAVEKLSESVGEDLKKISAACEEKKNSVQTGIKLMQVVGQMIKAPAFAKDLEQISVAMDALTIKLEILDEIKTSAENIQTGIADLTKINGAVAVQNKNMAEASAKVETAVLESSTEFKEVSSKLDSSSENLSVMFDDMRKDLNKLTTKLDAYNGLTKATLEQYTNLTEQDVRILEKISERVNGK